MHLSFTFKEVENRTILSDKFYRLSNSYGCTHTHTHTHTQWHTQFLLYATTYYRPYRNTDQLRILCIGHLIHTTKTHHNKLVETKYNKDIYIHTILPPHPLKIVNGPLLY